MLYKNIGIGDRLEIKSKTEISDKVYVSQVENIIDSNKITVYVPITYGQVLKLPIKKLYAFLFFTEKGIISFDGEIIEYNKVDGFNLMTVNLVSKGERVQRRGFFRFSSSLPFSFYVLDEEGNGGTKEDTICSGIIKDISGGGLRFISNEDIDEQTHIKCFIDLDKEVLITIGNIIQKSVFPKSNYKYQYRVSFVGILPEEQEKIVQFIFDEQRRVLQKLGRGYTK